MSQKTGSKRNCKTHRHKPRPFSDIEIGDKAEFEVTLTEEMHQAFSRLFCDYSPIHCDDEFCLKTKFEKRIGYAFLLTGLLSRLYGEYLPGGNSICIKQDAKFIRYFYVGDTVKIVGEVVDKIKSTKFVEIKTEVYRNGKERIFRGLGTVQILFEKIDAAVIQS